MIKTITPSDLSPMEMQAYLQGAIAPRPIAFASTIDEQGNPNLSPFSFFNIFSANPPILVFSPALRVRDATKKHTLINCENTREVVINVVNHAIVQQMSLSSTEYPEGVNEFEKAGLTMLKSDVIKPFRVAESPVQFECKVNEIIPLGEKAGAGNLVICEVVKMHIDMKILNEAGVIDPVKIDLVSRLGANWYSRSKDGLFEAIKPLTTLGIGVDSIPEHIKNCGIFDGNNLGKLGNVEHLPTSEEINIFVANNFEIKAVLSGDDVLKKYQLAKNYLEKEEILTAWKVLLA